MKSKKSEKKLNSFPQCSGSLLIYLFIANPSRAEKREKKAVETVNKQLEDRMQKIADVLGQFRIKNKFLKEEVSQKDLMIFEVLLFWWLLIERC